MNILLVIVMVAAFLGFIASLIALYYVTFERSKEMASIDSFLFQNNLQNE